MKKAGTPLSADRRGAIEDRVELYSGFRGRDSRSMRAATSFATRLETAGARHVSDASLILHLDIDCFFAQVEQLDHPEYRGRPVIVGGRKALIRIDPRRVVDDEHKGVDIDAPADAAADVSSKEAGRFRVVGRGVVCTSSYEARARGVRTAMPLNQALGLCPEAICVPGRYARYSEVSKQVFEVVREFSPIVRMASLDEAYFEIDGLERWTRLRFCGASADHDRCPAKSADDAWPVVFARALRAAIRERTSINVSIGIGPNAFIAKVASRRSKPNGLLYIPHGTEQSFARSLHVREVPGIGPAAANRLHRFGFHTLDDAARADRSQLVSELGNLGATIWERAHGRDGSGQDENSSRDAAKKVVHHDGRRSISRETTFREDVTDLAHLRSVLGYLTERACWSLRKEHLRARCVSVKIRFSDFTTLTRDRTLSGGAQEPEFTDHDDEIYGAVSALLEEVLVRRHRSAPRPSATRRSEYVGNGERSDMRRSENCVEPVRLLGVRLSHLSENAHRQWRFGEVECFERRNRLLQAADAIRNRFGFGAVAVGRSINLLESRPSKGVPKGGKNGSLFQGKNHAIGR